MSVRKYFEEVLAKIQKEEGLTYRMGYDITTMVRFKEGIVVGLANFKVVAVTIGASIGAAVMMSEDGEHKGTVNCLAVTPNGRVVSGSDDNTVRVWNLEDRKQEIKFEGHTERVSCVAITPDGRVVSGSWDRTVRVWNLAERREEIKFEGHTHSVICVAITPDGRVVSGSWDSTVRVWNLAERTEEIKFEGHTGRVNCLAMTPDGRVVSGSRDKTVRVWNLAERREEITFEGHTGYVTCVAMTPDGRVVSGSDDVTVRVWNLAERREETKLEGHTSNVCYIAITPDGRVVSGSNDGTVRVWNLAERKQEFKFDGHMWPVKGVAMMPDGRVVFVSDDKTVRVWNLTERKQEFKLERHKASVRCVAMTPDGWMVSASDDGTVQVWNLAERKHEIKFEGHEGEDYCVAMTPDGRVVSGLDDGTVRVWNLAERTEEIKFEGHTDHVKCLAMTPDGRVVSGSHDKTVRVWNLAERTEEIKFEGHTGYVTCVAITPDGRVVSGSWDCTVRVWNLAERKEEIKFQGHTNGVSCLAIAPDGRVVSGSWDKTVRVWNLAERREEIIFEGHTDWVNCVAMTPDGRVVSGSNDNTVRVWNLAERKEEIKLEGHTSKVWCVAITPDGRVVSGSHDKSVRVWNLAEHREEIKFEGHEGEVYCVALTPDGRVVSGSEDKTLRVWNLPECRDGIKFGEHSAVADGSKSQLSAAPTTVQTPLDLRDRIEEWKNGEYVSPSIAKCAFPSYRFNSLHICAYYNQFELVTKYLEAGVPVICGCFGTPLTLALQRNSIKCVDAILQFFITQLEDSTDKIWPEFDVIIGDLPELLNCSSSLLQTFFDSLMRPPLYPHLPEFIVPTLPLPRTLHLSSRFVAISDFNAVKPKDEAKQGESVLVKFFISLPRWNFTAGSEQSLKLLSAFSECENKLVLVTPYVSAIIEDKWNRCYAFTLTMTLLYFLLLCAISGVLFVDATSRLFILSFLAFNTFFILYELMQMLATGTVYFYELLNWVDAVRGGLSTAWAVLLLCGYIPVKGTDELKNLTLVVVVLCYLRGFTYFRSFKMTRIFVYMTLAVVKEMYSFLLILWYSVLAFGVFSAVMLEFDTMAESWTSGYNLLMGNFDNATYGVVEWIVFTGATMTNVVIMLNLLVSILGEAYEKTQMSVRENDLHQQLTLLIEYESMMFWRRHDNSQGTVVVTCMQGEDTSGGDEWQGQILQITRSIKSTVEDSFAKFSDKVTRIEDKIAEMGKIEEKVTRTEGKITGIEAKVTETEGEMTGIKVEMTGIKGELTGIKEKVTGMEGQLQAILGLLTSRS